MAAAFAGEGLQMLLSAFHSMRENLKLEFYRSCSALRFQGELTWSRIKPGILKPVSVRSLVVKASEKSARVTAPSHRDLAPDHSRAQESTLAFE